MSIAIPNVLEKASADLVVTTPFRHIVIDDALPADVYDRLSSTYPDPEKMRADRKTQNNKRYNLWSKWGVTEFPYETGSADWKAFSDFHTSHEFVRSVFDTFSAFKVNGASGEAKLRLDRFGPGLEKRLNLPSEVPIVQVVPRVTVAVNTPVREVSVVRGAHTDNARKAYVGLLYFRLPEDESTGGDLEIFRWKPNAIREDWPVTTREDQVECVRTIEYRPNRLVLFPTTCDALHGVSPRSVTNTWRRLVVISGWLPGVDVNDTDTMHGRLSGIKANMKAKLKRTFGAAKPR